MLAIPFQGFAASLQSGCALGHHRSDQSPTVVNGHDEHHDHASAIAAAPQSDASADSEAGTVVECKCGACGLGTALPLSSTQMSSAVPEAAPLGRFVDPQITMITGGPERPPRTLLA